MQTGTHTHFSNMRSLGKPLEAKASKGISLLISRLFLVRCCTICFSSVCFILHVPGTLLFYFFLSVLPFFCAGPWCFVFGNGL